MFGHLQIKSAYSFQESTLLINALIDNAKSKHIQALALTDDNNMYGAYEFYEACKKASIKPILGVNASIMFNDDLIHLALYARDDVGYKDLVRIVSDINLNENKAITLKALSNYRDHLYVVSHEYEDRLIEKEATSKEDLLTHAQIESPVLSFMKIMKKLFGASYRIMIVEDGLKGHTLRNQTLIKYAQFLDIPCIWGNDVRYLHPHDAFTLDLLQASKKGEVLSKDYEPLTSERYLKTEKEMKKILYSFVALAVCLSLTQCDNFLSVSSPNKSGDEFVTSSVSETYKTLSYCYGVYRGVAGGGNYNWNDSASDAEYYPEATSNNGRIGYLQPTSVGVNDKSGQFNNLYKISRKVRPRSGCHREERRVHRRKGRQ